MITNFRSKPFRFNSFCVTSSIALVMFVVISLFSSCVNDFNRGTCNKPDANSVGVSIGFSSPIMHEKAALRAELAPDDETAVHNLYLIIFDKNGDRVAYAKDKQLITPEGLLVQRDVELFPRMTYTFCLIANVDEKQDLMSGCDLATLNDVKTLTAFDELRSNLLLKTVQRINGGLLMAGRKQEVIPPLSSSNNFEPYKVDIPLEQLTSKVKFVIKTGDEVSFHPKSWQVCKAPVSVTFNPLDENKTLSGEQNFFDIHEQPFESPGNMFSFYILPNTKESLSPIVLDPLPEYEKYNSKYNQYKQRELQEKTDTSNPYYSDKKGFFQENGAFKYADPYATYVVVKGDYKKGNVSAQNVRYVVHLGYVGDDVNNWECNHNTAYTYTVTINGIDEVHTEVYADLEVNTAVEAHVFEKPARNAIKVDAPFSTGLIHFNTEEVRNIIKGNIKFSCYTPYDDGGQQDYDWVKFIIHKIERFVPPERRKEPGGKLVPYPGDKSRRLYNIKELITALQTGKDKDGNPLSGQKDLGLDGFDLDLSVYINEFYYKDKPEWVDFSGDWARDGWRTFVNKPDRKLYIYWGTSENIRKSRDQKSSWSHPDVSIEQKSIVTPYSLDPNVFSNGDVALGMEAVQDDPSFVEYPKGALLGGDTPNQDYWTGALNMYASLPLVFRGLFVGTPSKSDYSWNKFVKVQEDQYVINPTVDPIRDNRAQFECLRMNRDENGDGVIDESELKWYTPAIYEYLVLGGLGSLGTPVESRLAPKAPYDDFYHFASSTRSRNLRFTEFMYFAEQYVSFKQKFWDPILTKDKRAGTQSRVYDYVNNSDLYGRFNVYYRCARRLGILPQEETELKPANPPFKLENTNTGHYKISVTLDVNSVRPASMTIKNGELPQHDQLSIFNRPARSFYVAQQTLNTSDEEGYNFADSRTACATYRENGLVGWRLPNVAELSIMLLKLVDEKKYIGGRPRPGDDIAAYNLGWINLNGEYDRDANNVQDKKVYWSATKFSEGAYYYVFTKGILAPTIELARPENAKGFVRCVKDAE